jgi:threonine dehydrogenase-like Zn-dependent dehydrogenase
VKALTWQGNENVQLTDVADPQIQAPTDAIIRVTSTAICGSDLHLYGVLGPYLKPGDVLGHEAMGIVEEVGSEVANLSVGHRVVVPFNISCGHCWMCTRGLFAQCETTQVVSEGKGASLFGYTSLYGSVPGGQAEFLRVPQAQFGPIKVPDGTPDEQFLFLSDILPTAWQAVVYADVPKGGTVAIFGLGPVGQFAVRIAKHLGAGRVIAIDSVPERLALAERHGGEPLDLGSVDNISATLIVSVSGVYGGEIDPLPMMEMFDRGIQLRMGQAHVRRWTDDILPLVLDPSDPLGTLDLITHRLPLSDAPDAYKMFREKSDGCIKVVLQP